ncbi:hypothetical protein [Bacillus cereus]|uniref:hypothetical protein n=1 Tax=Bacillus cereus TaxID=1396 RepID=UPI000BF2A38E|nr:hypothetical protein [Bacillus cereus]PFA91054.1 hypothetical protein CN393_07850 [Bacillus cereus]
MIKKIVGLLFIIGLLGGCTVSQEDGKSDSKADKPKQIESPNKKPDDSAPKKSKKEMSIRVNEDGSYTEIGDDGNEKPLDPKEIGK